MIAVQHLPSVVAARRGSHAPSVMRALLMRLHQWCCGWHGHELVWVHEPGRVALCCLECGFRTPGWRIEPRAAYGPLAPPRAHLAR